MMYRTEVTKRKLHENFVVSCIVNFVSGWWFPRLGMV